jgi:hypothetical protein
MLRVADPPAGVARVRVAVLAGLLAVLVAAGVLEPQAATAHRLGFSTVELEVGKDLVTGEIRLPFESLLVLPFPESSEEAAFAWISDYVGRHMSARGADGRAWEVRTDSDGKKGYEVAVKLSLTPPRGKVTDFSLTYDALIERVPSHKAIAVLRGGDGKSRELGIFEANRRTLDVEVGANGGSVSHFKEFKSAVGLGTEHISEGADHLLFLLMLLLPAPLMIRAGRWVRCDDPWRSVRRIVHVVTAFAVGHSITLVLAGIGLIHVPSRPVEALIALSILVAGIHDIRPLIPRGEVVIAVVFGLVHGLAFASLLGELDLDRSSLLFSLLGFNLGIELTQLLVVALLMPSLYLLSRTAVYTPFRVGGGLLGIVLATSWFLERTALTPTDPFEPFTTGLVEHPFLFSATMAVFAVAAYFLSSNRAPLAGATDPPSD